MADIDPEPSQGRSIHGANRISQGAETGAAEYYNPGFSGEELGGNRHFGPESSRGDREFGTASDSEETVPKTIFSTLSEETVPKTSFSTLSEETVPKTSFSAHTSGDLPHRARRHWDVFYASPGEDLTSHSESQNATGAHKLMKLAFMTSSFTLVLVSAVLCRLCLMTVTFHLRPKKPSNRTHDSSSPGQHPILSHAAAPTDSTNVQWIWAAVLLIVAPYVFTMCSSLWKLAFKTTGKLYLPTLLVAFLQESVHSFGLCTLVFYVLPRYDPLLGSLLLSSTVAIPAFVKMAEPHNQRSSGENVNEENRNNSPRSVVQRFFLRPIVQKVLDVSTFIIQATLICLWTYREYAFSQSILMTSLLLVSLVFVSVGSLDNYVISGFAYNMSSHSPVRTMLRRRKTKVCFLVSIWKVVFTFAYAGILYSGSSDVCWRVFLFLKNYAQDCSLDSSLKLTSAQPLVELSKCSSYLPFYLACISIAASALCYKIGKSACQVQVQTECFALPLSLVTPLTFGLLCVFQTHPEYLKVLLGCPVSWPDIGSDGSLETILQTLQQRSWLGYLGCLSYVTYIYVTKHVWWSRAEKMARTERLFVNPLYCGVLVDQSLMTNRKVYDRETTIFKEQQPRFLRQSDGNIARPVIRHTTPTTTPIIFVCATMWHETRNEMIQILKSIMRLDADQCSRKLAQNEFEMEDPDYYTFEAHIFFDDAFEKHAEDETIYSVNNYVKQLVETVSVASSAVHKEARKVTLTRAETPYGGRLQWTLPGENTLTVHLKDNVKIRHKKRWSQVMYMYYFLGHKLMSANLSKAERGTRAANTFILALDGDIDFQPTAVQILVDRMKKNPRLGAACGRIHPIGSGPMVWYQKFEYAVSHWLQKSTEHMLGCVLCSPGCFSLFRGYALMDDNVMKRYSTPSTEARHYVQYDQGEDRWLCTLLLQRGYRVEYCAVSDSFTNAPEGFTEFYRQRRRWTPSTIANVLDLLQSWKTITKRNKDITILYLFYQLILFISGMITPGTTFLLILSAINTAYPDIPLYGALLINLIPVTLFSIVCFKATPDTQAAFAGFLSLIYSMLMTLVLVGLIKQAATYGFCSVSTIFLAIVIGIFVTTALMHPMELTCLFHGFLYFLCIPSMSMLLTIYSLANIHDVSWGTREDPQAKEPQAASNGNNQILDLFGSGFTSGVTFSLGNLFRCLCCPRKVEEVTTKNEQTTPVKRTTKWIDEPKLWDGELSQLSDEETDFWTNFIPVYLKPLQKNDEKEAKVRLELIELRNKSCLAFFILNILFIILVYTLETISQSTTNLSVKIPCSLENFKGEKIEPISVTFTLVFGLLLTVQFLAMLFHRYSTLLQITSITKLVDTHKITPQKAVEIVKGMITSKAEQESSVVPSIPEANYSDDEDEVKSTDTPLSTVSVRRRKSSTLVMKQIERRDQSAEQEPQTLSRVFENKMMKMWNDLRDAQSSDTIPDMAQWRFRKLTRNRKLLHSRLFRNSSLGSDHSEEHDQHQKAHSHREPQLTSIEEQAPRDDATYQWGPNDAGAPEESGPAEGPIRNGKANRGSILAKRTVVMPAAAAAEEEASGSMRMNVYHTSEPPMFRRFSVQEDSFL